MHEAHPVGEKGREHPEPGADLEHDVVRLELGETTDHAEDVRVREEVLAEVRLGPSRNDAQGFIP